MASPEEDERVLFSARREIDLLLPGYPKTVTRSVPNAAYGNFYESVLEELSDQVPEGYQLQVFGQFKSVTDGDTSWKQPNSYGYLRGSAPADLSGANMYQTDVSSQGNRVIFEGANWNTGPGGSARTVTLQIRWWCYLTRFV